MGLYLMMDFNNILWKNKVLNNQLNLFIITNMYKIIL